MRLGDFYFTPSRWKVGQRIQTEGTTFGNRVFLLWQGKRHFILHSPSQPVFSGGRRWMAQARLYLMRMMRSQPGATFADIEWECRQIKSITSGKFFVRARREIIAEAMRLDEVA